MKKRNSESGTLSKCQVEALAWVMQFLYGLGFDLRTVKRAADAWWKVKKT